MAALDFPTSPVVGQSYTSGNGTTYYWTGTFWSTTFNNVTTVGLPVISETITTGSASSVVISNIPQIYRDLKIIISGRSTASATDVQINLQLNGDTAAHYSGQDQAISVTTVFGWGTGSNQTQAVVGALPAASGAASVQSTTDILISNYAGTTFQKSLISIGGWNRSNTTFFTTQGAWTWASTAAVNSITITPSAGAFVDGSIVTVYGIGGAVASNASSSGSMLWVGTTAPSNPITNPLWWKSDDGILLIYYNDGTSSQWINSNSVPSANTIKYTSLQKTTAQSTTNGVWTSVSWDTTPIQDDVSAFSSSAPTQITVPSGYTKMRVTFYGVWAINNTGLRGIRYTVGGTAKQDVIVLAADISCNSMVTKWITVSSGNVITLDVLQSSGGTLNFSSASGNELTATAQIEWMQ